MQCLPQRQKSTLFDIFSNGPGGYWSEKKFQTTLILVFEVIVQPHKTHFLTFLCETKIMKITHSAISAGFNKFRNVANGVQDTDNYCNNNWYDYMHHPAFCHDKIFEKKNWKENES